jgi:hypothetical protein
MKSFFETGKSLDKFLNKYFKLKLERAREF